MVLMIEHVTLDLQEENMQKMPIDPDLIRRTMEIGFQQNLCTIQTRQRIVLVQPINGKRDISDIPEKAVQQILQSPLRPIYERLAQTKYSATPMLG